MPQFDQTIPLTLLNTQTWFGELITTPLVGDNLIAPVTPRGITTAEEASRYISPSPTLRPEERLQIYNQQYWWRLLTTLQELFPLTLRLFGYDEFNQAIGVPFLSKYRPNSWSLNDLGLDLPRWIKEDYRLEDQTLILAAAELDLAYYHLYLKPRLPPINADSLGEDFSEIRLKLQPHVYLFSYPFDLFPFRREMLKENPEHWIQNDFPEISKQTTHTLLFRKINGNSGWKHLSEVEYALLCRFKGGATILSVCEWLEEQPPPFRSQAEENLQDWFREWTRFQIFTAEH